MALDARRQLFVDQYLLSWNATRAAIEAGYSARSAYSQGSRLLKNDEVQQAIRERMAALTMQADEVLYRLTEHARADIGQFVGKSIPELIEHPMTRLIKEIDHEIRAKKEVDIGTSGEYPGMFLTLDRELGYINKSIAEGKWVSDAQKKFKAAVEREGSGYVQPGEDRPVSHFVKADQAINLIKAMYAYKMYDHTRKESLLDRWANAGKSERNRLMSKVQDMAKRGLLYFMN